MRSWRSSALFVVAVVAVSGCAGYHDSLLKPPTALTDQRVLEAGSTAFLHPTQGRVITDNDVAFASKLRMIEDARSSLDMMYYAYDDDYSSAVFSEALIAAAVRGARVRLLLDYNTCYKNLDYYLMLEQEARRGTGSLEVRFYNRPTRRVVRDAAFMTLGCSGLSEGRSGCDEAKLRKLDRRFAAELIDGQPVTENTSNLDVAESGLFLSGLYDKRPDLMALAVTRGQGLDPEAVAGASSRTPPEQLESLKRLGRIYWQSRTGPPFQRLLSRIQMSFAFLVFGEQITPIFDTFTSILPAEQADLDEHLRDWRHLTDFLHHKLLLADGSRLQLGGRNVGDSYHLRSHPLVEKYAFDDTDIYLELDAGDGEQVARSFEGLWDFRQMVADLSEVRAHAPNDFAANAAAAVEAEAACASIPEEQRPDCMEQELGRRLQSLDERLAIRREGMMEKARIYREEYLAEARGSSASPSFELDRDAAVIYVENLPFDKDLPVASRTRNYATGGADEAAAGKNLHHLWRAALINTCGAASAEAPRRVILHHAYFLPPAKLLRTLGDIASGRIECRHVTVQILTNSFETTDLSIVNTLVRHQLKALTEFLEAESRPESRARFEIYEYLPKTADPKFSLHSKVSILGEDLIIGSANFDVRSFVADSNNGVFIRGADDLRNRLVDFIDARLTDPEQVVAITDAFTALSRDEMVRQDLAAFGTLLAKYGIDKRLSPQQNERLTGIFLQLLNDMYRLTHAALRRNTQRSHLDEYDDVFRTF